MRICCTVHADYEEPGYFERWAKEKNISFQKVYLHRGEILPELSEFDTLLCMGGPQSANETDKYPYLQNEIDLIKKAIREDKIVIGVCLGAQLIGKSYGEMTIPSPSKEMGVFPITLTNEGIDDPYLNGLPQTFLSGHWHNDMPGLPPQAVILAQSEGCPRQMIKFDKKVYGFQCHLEFNRADFEIILDRTGKNLPVGKYIQTEEAILNQDFNQINAYLGQFLDRFFKV